VLIAPIASTYATRVPYVTVAEFKRHPSGTDTKNLVPGQSQAVNDQSLKDILLRASSYADNIVEKVLAATIDTQYGDYSPGRGGLIKVPLDNSPIVGVIDVQLGLAPGSLVPRDDLSGCDLQGRILSIPVGYGVRGGPSRVYAKVRYVNGWANAQLDSSVNAGATSLTLNNALGVVPGMTLALSGPTAGESVVVADSFVPVSTLASTEVPLAAGTGSAYAMGDVATTMPQSIKLAVILLACSIIKTRGSNAIVMASVHGKPDQETPFEDGAEGEYGMAVDLLSPYRRVI
jgi:hypothetical protein